MSMRLPLERIPFIPVLPVILQVEKPEPQQACLLILRGVDGLVAHEAFIRLADQPESESPMDPAYGRLQPEQPLPEGKPVVAFDDVRLHQVLAALLDDAAGIFPGWGMVRVGGRCIAASTRRDK